MSTDRSVTAEAASKQMKAAGVTPSVVTYSSLIRAYDKGPAVAEGGGGVQANEGDWGDAERRNVHNSSIGA